MSAIDRQQMVGTLVLLVTALFVASGTPVSTRWRRGLRLGAIAGFALAVVAVLVEIALWAAGGRP